MNSDQDLLTEGFPHSDIRGSTIARISPRLIAACHVLHRLLAPRHPPNALLSLHHTITARAQGQIAPRPACSSCVTSATSPKARVRRHSSAITYTYTRSDSHCKRASPNTPGANATLRQQAPGPSGNPLVFLCRSREHPWRQSDSNRRPPACKAGALPTELCPRMGLDSTSLTFRAISAKGGNGPGRT